MIHYSYIGFYKIIKMHHEECYIGFEVMGSLEHEIECG